MTITLTITPPRPVQLAVTATPSIKTYDAHGSETPTNGLGTLVRTDGDKPSGDAAIDAAHDNAGIVRDFYQTVLKRNSIDGKGMDLKSVVHFGTNYNNAYWDGEKMTYGDGDGKTFSPLSGAVDVVGHEMSHGVTEATAGLAYAGQSGALNESWSDVMGELIQQWSRNKQGFGTVEAAKGADWLIGEDVFTPGVPGDALRSMKAPGTAYAGDPQPANMRDYKRMTADNGGVHVNSGIPNKAAYEAAIRIGGEKVAQVWYDALTKYLRPNSTFSDAAGATIAAANELYGTGDVSQAVTDAWNAVGVSPRAPKGPRTASDMPKVPAPHADGGGVVPPWLASGVPTEGVQLLHT